MATSTCYPASCPAMSVYIYIYSWSHTRHKNNTTYSPIKGVMNTLCYFFSFKGFSWRLFLIHIFIRIICCNNKLLFPSPETTTSGKHKIITSTSMHMHVRGTQPCWVSHSSWIAANCHCAYVWLGQRSPEVVQDVCPFQPRSGKQCIHPLKTNTLSIRIHDIIWAVVSTYVYPHKQHTFVSGRESNTKRNPMSWNTAKR